MYIFGNVHKVKYQLHYYFCLFLCHGQTSLSLSLSLYLSCP